MGSLHEVREEYVKDSLTRDNVHSSPFEQFEMWLNYAREKEVIHWNAMTLATANKDGIPSARTVLLKESTENGFVFYTNYNSDKGQDLTENPNASLLFYWRELERQVKVMGTVEKVPREDSVAYFKSRPLGSRISATISDQSKEVPDREYLEKLYKEFESQHEEKEIECPENWGGFILKPNKFEFWQGRVNRLHDRIAYDQVQNHWETRRLAP